MNVKEVSDSLMCLYFIREKFGFALEKDCVEQINLILNSLLNHPKRQIRKLAGIVLRNFILN